MAKYDELKKDLLADGIIDATEVKRLQKEVYADGVVDRDEADLLFALNDATSGAANDPAWRDFFIQALADHVLKDEVSPGVVDEDEAQYLISKIQADGVVDGNELALLVHVIANAKGAPESLSNFVLAALKGAVLADGIIDAAEVEMIRKVIYGTGGAGGQAVERVEADFLFELNDATSGQPNDPSWQQLFVEALCAHLLEDEVSPGVVDEDEAEWLIGRIEKDGVYDDNEKALLAALKKQAKGVAPRLKAKL